MEKNVKKQNVAKNQPPIDKGKKAEPNPTEQDHATTKTHPANQNIAKLAEEATKEAIAKGDSPA